MILVPAMSESKLSEYKHMLERSGAHSHALQESLPQAQTRREISFLHVFAPVLVEFVEWVLEQAKKDGKTRLYFLARDGWMMHRAAEQLCRARDLAIDCRYLKVSRYAVRQAQYHLLGEKSLDLLCGNGIDITFEKVMKRAGLTSDEAQIIARQTGREASFCKVLHSLQLQELKEELRAAPDFMRLVAAHAEQAYPAATGYLRQEGLLDRTPFALVDTGWIGTLQLSIQNLIKEPIQGYYFGLYEIPADCDPHAFRGFYFGAGDHVSRKAHFSNSLLEAVFSAPEGMTIGYEQNATFRAVESENPNPNADTIRRFAALADLYVQAYAEALRGAAHRPDMAGSRLLSAELLPAFMASPSAEEVEDFGELLFCDDVLELQMQKVAAALTDEEIRDQRLLSKLLILAGIKKKTIHESAWIEGSIVRNGVHVPAYLRHAALAKHVIYYRKARKFA